MKNGICFTLRNLSLSLSLSLSVYIYTYKPARSPTVGWIKKKKKKKKKNPWKSPNTAKKYKTELVKVIRKYLNVGL